MWETYLKYFLWILSMGLAFSGTWLFHFTKDHPTNPNRKKFTKSGKWGFGLAIFCFLLAFKGFISDDITARNSKQRVEDQNKIISEQLVLITKGLGLSSRSPSITGSNKDILPMETNLELDKDESITLILESVDYPQSFAGVVWAYDEDRKPIGSVGRFSTSVNELSLGSLGNKMAKYLLIEGVVMSQNDNPSTPYKIRLSVFENGGRTIDQIISTGVVGEENVPFIHRLNF